MVLGCISLTVSLRIFSWRVWLAPPALGTRVVDGVLDAVHGGFDYGSDQGGVVLEGLVVGGEAVGGEVGVVGHVEGGDVETLAL